MRDVTSKHTVSLTVYLPFNVDIRQVDTPWSIGPPRGADSPLDQHLRNRVVREWVITATDDLSWQRADESIEDVQAAIAWSLDHG